MKSFWIWTLCLTLAACHGIQAGPADVQTTDTQAVHSPAALTIGRSVGTYHDSYTARDLVLVESPAVHSLTTTTANLLWTTSLPAMCEIAWGTTMACENTRVVGAKYFGSYSLTDLVPGQTYYFQIRSLTLPDELADDYKIRNNQGSSPPLSFTTKLQDAGHQTYYVAPTGDDDHDGRTEANAWRTLSHAAATVIAGDTVLIAEGRYNESIRMLATGTEHAPITFKAIPGHKVVIAGADKQLNQGFIAIGKKHLRFDMLYFEQFNALPLQGWRLGISGEFMLHQCSDIQITRCFSDGRGGYTARFITAWDVDNLLIRNCVILNKMSGAMMLWSAPGFQMDHCVSARPLISTLVLRNQLDQPATFTNNIFTDMLAKKAKLNIRLFTVDSRMTTPLFDNNCFYLREFGPEERHLVNDQTIGQLKQTMTESLFANPRFQGDSSEDGSSSGIDNMMNPEVKLDFHDFFPTSVEVIQRQCGLQREAFGL